MPKTLIEPFRIKSIEPIRMTTREAERERYSKAAKLNVFKLRAEDVLIDWLTDSGTGAMSSNGGAPSWRRRELRRRAQLLPPGKVIQDITGMQYFVPTHQGRAAERCCSAPCASPVTWCPTTATSTPRAATWNTWASRPWTW